MAAKNEMKAGTKATENSGSKAANSAAEETVKPAGKRGRPAGARNKNTKKAEHAEAAVKAAPAGGVVLQNETEKDFSNPEYYTNRELSWLKFNGRCLSEARDTKIVPLFERLKFLSITQSNLDEFFMVRIASLKDQKEAGYEKPDIAGMTPENQLEELSKAVHEFVALQYSTYSRSLVPALAKAGLVIVSDLSELTENENRFLDRYFEEVIYPVLTPMALDSSRPFPLIRNKTLNIGALIADKPDTDNDGEKKAGTDAAAEEKSSRKKASNKKVDAKKTNDNEHTEFATVQVPDVLPRIIELPAENESSIKRIILLELVVRKYIGVLFQHYDVVCSSPYRIMRNADLEIDEEEASDLLIEIQKQIKKRQWGEVIRLEVDEDIDPRLLKILRKEFKIQDRDLYEISGPLDLTVCMKMYGLSGFEKYKEKGHAPAQVKAFSEAQDIFSAIRKHDILVHHPYMSFDPVVEFVRSAAKDPGVLAIKQTLYRVSGNSPIVSALAQAADNGKQVTVLVELKARFDEEHNIVWAKMLEKAGVHVIYGLLGLKVHSKITMIVRREEDGIRRYVHLGTGNYNDSTAKLYTDLGLFTCDASIGRDATAVFNMLSGYSEPDRWYKLLVAPIWMKNDFLRMIRRETENAKAGKKAFIRAKMNSLCDPVIIAELYRASAAGVNIQLLIRGICCLKTGIPGVSEHISVRSIVGNYLEHSRIFWFLNGGEDEIYMGSADWMPRNLDRRVEIVFPVDSPELKREIMHILDTEFDDNVKAHILQPDGSYEKPDRRGKSPVNSQEIFCEEADALSPKEPEPVEEHRFTPAQSIEES